LAISAWSLPAVASAVFFGAWLLLSVVGQFLHPHDSWIRKSAIGWLVPDWRFFAPEPLVEHHVVVHRFKSAANEVDPLQTLTLQSAGPLRWLWNPQIRQHKAVLDLTDGLHKLADRSIDHEARSDYPDALVLTEPYLVLLNLVSAQVGASRPGLVQFGVVLSAWPDREELVFLSRWHAVEAKQEPLVAQGEKSP
jgi:hypothetical protein